MPMSEARKAANKKWNDANMKERYDRIQLVVAKGQKERIQAAAASQGESLNAFVWRVVSQELDKMERGVISILSGVTAGENAIVDGNILDNETEESE